MRLVMLLAPMLFLGGCMALSVDGNQRKDGVGETVVGQSLARSKDAVCMNNLKQIRLGIQVQMGGEETPPADLSALKFPADMLVCPIDKKPYVYDPTTGTVKCEHKGHEKY